MKLRIGDTERTIVILSWLQIVGGITGIGLVAYLMLQTADVNGAVLLIFLTGLALFTFSIYCGKSLLKDKNKIPAVILSIVNYAMQVIQWSLLGYGFSYSTGAEVTMGISIPALDFKFNIAAVSSSFNMSINSGTEFMLKVNLIAVMVVWVLSDILDELRTANMDPELKVEEIATS